MLTARPLFHVGCSPAFSNALFGGKLLEAESLALMVKPGLDDYGYGLWSYETRI